MDNSTPYRARTDLDPDAGLCAGIMAGNGALSHVQVRCPCGCGSELILPLEPTDVAPAWHLRGPAKSPSLFPAILFPQADDPDADHWFGWLINGVWLDSRQSAKLELVNCGVNVVEDDSASLASGG